MDKNALEQLLSSYNWWMGISTVAVAVGILGEYVAHFIFEKEARDNKREMAVSIVFGLLVLGGVVGEYVFGKKLSQVSEQLQQMADTEVAQSNRDAAAARKDSEFARMQSANTYERAVRAEQQASQENVRAAKALEAAEVARKSAEGFRFQIAQANERAANAEKQAEEERIARIKIELAIKLRRLTAEQKSDLISVLKPFAPASIIIEMPGNADAETTDLVSDMSDAIVGAGIPMNGDSRKFMMGQSFRGFIFRFGDNRQVEAEAIAQFLFRADLATGPVSRESASTPDELVIRIGAKPVPTK